MPLRFIHICQSEQGESGRCAADCRSHKQHCHARAESASQTHSHLCVQVSQLAPDLLSSHPKQPMNPVVKEKVEQFMLDHRQRGAIC
jgi:hypothetical protein